MTEKLTQPLETYALAFQAYLGFDTPDFLIKTNGVFLVYHEGVTYKISHYDDFVWNLKSYFTGSHTHIYTETSFGLWFYLFDKHKEISQEDQIIDFYNAWKIYWDHEALFYGTGDSFENAKQHGWEDFELFLTRVKANPETIVQSAIEISDIHLIPVIALAMKMRHRDEEDFYKECVDILVERYPHDFGILGDVYEVDLDPQNPNTKRYFIGESEYDFHRYRELGEE